MPRYRLTRTVSGLAFDVELRPDQRAYCFIGENGAGKTSLLESLAQALLYTHDLWLQPARRGDASWPAVRNEWGTQVAFNKRLAERQLPVPDGTMDNKSIKPPRNADWDVIAVVDIAKVGTQVPRCRRPIVFIPASRRATIDNIGPAALKLVGDSLDSFLDALERTLDGVARVPVATATVAMWFAARLMINPAFVVGTRPAMDEVVALLALLRDFDPAHFEAAVHKNDKATAVNAFYRDGQLWLLGRPIDRLPSGYVALIKVLQEIVSSLAAWEAMRSDTPLLESDAIILIDELDAHLHPRWQRNLLPFLTRTFPNATFYVTTHSPLVVRDTEPGQAYELVREGDEVRSRELGSPRDWYLSDVLSDAFHVDLPPVGSDGSEAAPPLLDLMLQYSRQVKEFTASSDPDERTEALGMHEAIVERLPEDDPRRATIDQLRQLLG